MSLRGQGTHQDVTKQFSGDKLLDALDALDAEYFALKNMGSVKSKA